MADAEILSWTAATAANGGTAVHASGFQLDSSPREDRDLLLGGEQDVETPGPVDVHGEANQARGSGP